MLVLLYYLSQNPDFPERVKPLMGQLKNSQQMLGFLNELSNFSKTFGAFGGKNETECKQSKTPKKDDDCNEENKEHEGKQNEKNPQSPTKGIADDFIEQILESYLKKH